MSSSLFTVVEHTVPASHVREYPHAVRQDTPPLRLSVKQYTPRSNPSPLPADALTIIAGHAIGVPKETYSPLWDTLLSHSRRTSPPVFTIRSIYIADCAHLGQSHMLNAADLGDDPSWHDHARDLLHLVNQFRMPRPIVGVGHSMSCAQILHLATLHPRLMSGVILSEPVILSGLPRGPNPAVFASLRRDRWGSREEAERELRNAPYFRAWDRGALELYLEYGLREMDGDDGNRGGGEVSLTTPKAQEAWSYNRGMLTPFLSGQQQEERQMNPHLAGTKEAELAFFRPESLMAEEALTSVRPAVLYIYGDESPINSKASRQDKLARTGIGRGGNGGKTADMVNEVIVQGTGHMGPFEKTSEWAEAMAAWLGRETRRWKQQEERIAAWDSGKSERNQDGDLVLSKKWMEWVKKKSDARREQPQKL